MNRFAILAAIAVGCFGLLVSDASAQARTKSTAKKPAAKAVQKASAPADEIGLVGIKLYDPATNVLKMFGSPDMISGVGAGGGAIGPVGGGAGPGSTESSRGNPMGGGPGRAGGGGAGPGPGAGPSMSGAVDTPFGFADELLRFQGMGPAMNPPSGGGGGGGGRGAAAPSGGPGPAMGPSGGGGAGGGGSFDNPSFTRWVYNRTTSKYGFIVDKHGRVVQIEAIGITDPKVRTSRGLSFGARFDTLVKAYGNPEGYEISGDTMVLRFLQKNKVAFRLARIEPKKPHVVTGIVIAGGKA